MCIIMYLQREIIFYIQDLEKELRRQKRISEVDIMYELSEELGLYPSKYQRPNMLVQGLRAQPVWTLEQSGFGAELGQLVENWDQVQGGPENITDTGWTRKYY